jgi:hypothetical protein
MANISSRVFSDGTKKLLSLSNGEYKRGISVGNNWTRLRVGILVAQNPNGVLNLTSGTRFILGICSGQTYGFGGGANTVNAIGVNVTGRSFGGNNWWFTYNGGTTPSYSGAGGVGFYNKVGSTLSEFGGNATPPLVMPSTTGTVQRRFPLYLEVQKGSPDYTASFWHSPVADEDYTVSAFETGLQSVATPPTINGHFFAGYNATITASEAPGVLDTVNFYTNFVEAVELYEIAAFKVA